MFKLEFDTGNAAFEEYGYVECARILTKVIAQLEAGAAEGPISDINGNVIGRWSVTLPEAEED